MIELTSPGSAVRHASVARHITNCATRPGLQILWIQSLFLFFQKVNRLYIVDLDDRNQYDARRAMWKSYSVLYVDSNLGLVRQNMSLGFPTKQVSNQSSQLHRLARKLKFHL